MIRLENFYTGIFTEPGKLPQGVTTAADVSNLQVDKNGFLRPRIGTSGIGPNFALTDPRVSGVAQVGNILFLQVNGSLYTSTDAGATNTLITGVSGLSGRLSVLGNWESFVILTSEGEDNGYWIDISDPSAMVAYRLGFAAPDFTPAFGEQESVGTSAPQWNKYYYYKFTFARDVEDGDGPFDDIEGPASESFESAPGTSPDPGKVHNRTMTLAYPSWDATAMQITEIRIYRSDAYDMAETEPENFKLVGSVDRPGTTFTDRLGDSDRTTDLEETNQGFPAEATSLVYYNGRIFATCEDELRYNDVTSGNPRWHVWPAKNSIRRREVHFAFEYRGVLYFGDREHTWAITGIPETPSFAAQEVAQRGALSTYAATVLEGGVGILSEGGMFIGDGINWQRVSGPLDEFFKSDSITDGHVLQIPNGDILWSCFFASGKHRQFLMHTGGAGVRWEAWHGVEAVQSGRALSSLVGVRGFHDTWVDSDGDHWLFGDENFSTTELLFASNDARLRVLHWADERSGERDEDLDWFWESHDVFYRQDALAMDDKLFRALLVRGTADADVTLRFNLQGSVVDDDVVRMVEQTVTLRGGRPTQVPIRRHGESLSFRLSGTGDCQIRGFYLEFDVQRALR